DIGFPPDDAFALAFEAKPVVGDAAGVLATLDLHAADAAALRSTDGYPTHILRRQGREVDVHGAILRPAPFQQFAHQLRAVLPGGFPVNRIGGVVGLTQGNGRNAQQGAGKGTADGAGVGHRVADIGSAIDTGQNQIRLGRQQLGDTEQDAVTGRAADAEAALLELVNPQRMVYRNGHGDATLIQVGGDQPYLLGDLVGDLLEHLEARPAPAVVVGQQYAFYRFGHEVPRLTVLGARALRRCGTPRSGLAGTGASTLLCPGPARCSAGALHPGVPLLALGDFPADIGQQTGPLAYFQSIGVAGVALQC